MRIGEMSMNMCSPVFMLSDGHCLSDCEYHVKVKKDSCSELLICWCADEAPMHGFLYKNMSCEGSLST